MKNDKPQRIYTVGGLFAGYGGIELGLEATGRYRAVWHCEINPYCNAVLERRWPGVPNHGDISKVDWSAVERPDVLVGGFPCQDVSLAGQRAGLVEGSRTGLWHAFADCVRALRPRLILAENVAGLFVPQSDGNYPIAIVLAELASLGYDAEWRVVSAASVGARHRRDRVFIVAWRRDDSNA